MDTTGPRWGETTEAKAALAELEALAQRCTTTGAREAVRQAQTIARGTTDTATRVVYGGYSARDLSRALRAARRAAGAL